MNGKIETVMVSVGKREDRTPRIKTTPIREFALAIAKQDIQTIGMASQWMKDL